MYSKIKIWGYPINPLVAYPVAFYTVTFVCYTVFTLSHHSFWFKMAFVANAAGVLIALIAALPGFIEWSLGIPEKTEVKAIGLKHMLCNMIALMFFAVNLYSNSRQWDNAQSSVSNAVFLSAAGLLCTIVAGLLGWKLLEHYHIGIDTLTPLDPLTSEEIEAATQKH